MVLACVILFLLCVFSDSRCCSVFSGFVWFPVLLLAFMDDHDVDHPVVGHTENISIVAYIHQHLNTFLLFDPTLISIYNHTLN